MLGAFFRYFFLIIRHFFSFAKIYLLCAKCICSVFLFWPNMTKKPKSLQIKSSSQVIVYDTNYISTFRWRLLLLLLCSICFNFFYCFFSSFPPLNMCSGRDIHKINHTEELLWTWKRYIVEISTAVWTIYNLLTSTNSIVNMVP